MSGTHNQHDATARRALIEPLEKRSLLSVSALDVYADDVVTEWNRYATEAMQHDTFYKGPVRAARNLAMVHGAMYDAINGVYDLYEPFFSNKVARYGADPEAAAVAAAAKVLCKLYPDQKSYIKADYHDSLARIPDGKPEKWGIKHGKAVANQYLKWRRYDNSQSDAFYEHGNRPGDWQPTPPTFADPVHPGGGRVTPFAIDSVEDFLPVPPPELTTQEYADAYNEVYDLGGRDSPFRTADQTEIGAFWAYDRAGLGTPLVLYNQVIRTVAAEQGNTLLENARLFAMANTAMADAGIVAWECKYIDNFWRPVTGIHEGAYDGNLATVGDETWEPLGSPGGPYGPNFTPAFPAYVSGHSTFGGALFQTLYNFYGTDNISFSLASDELPGVVRHYDSFSEAEEENGSSRIYLGVHWRFDDTYGREAGHAVADHVFENWFRPTV